jgi:hypothetical protein
MFVLYLASAIASIGWATAALVFSQRDGKTKVLAKYTSLSTSHMGGAGTTTNEHFYTLKPFPVRTLVIYIILGVLPTLVVLISQAWLAIGFLIVLALILLVLVGLMIKGQFTLLNAPVFMDKKLLPPTIQQDSEAYTERWTHPDGEVTEYMLVKRQQNTTAITIWAIILPLIWVTTIWLLSIFGLQGWYLVGATNVVGFVLSFVIVLFLRMYQ